MTKHQLFMKNACILNGFNFDISCHPLMIYMDEMVRNLVAGWLRVLDHGCISLPWSSISQIHIYIFIYKRPGHWRLAGWIGGQTTYSCIHVAVHFGDYTAFFWWLFWSCCLKWFNSRWCFCGVVKMLALWRVSLVYIVPSTSSCLVIIIIIIWNILSIREVVTTWWQYA